MKKLLIIILLFTLGCNKDSSNTVESSPELTDAPITGDTGTSTSGSNSGIEYPSELPKSWTEEFMDLVNAHRTGMGLRSLIHNEDLAQIVREHSQNMANGSVAFGHSGFSTRCSDARSALGGGNWCGENVAAGQRTPQAAFTSWMNSSGHRANIESTRATHTGFGYAKNSSGKYYWTQIFIQN